MTDGDAGHAASTRRCPICGKPPSPSERPFCSRRCADVDLNRWLSGGYAVPAGDLDDEDDPDAADPDPAGPR